MNSENGILLLGGGGHCKSVLSVLLVMNAYMRIGIVDEGTDAVLGVPVVGSDKDVLDLRTAGYNCGFITVGNIGDTAARRRLWALLSECGFLIPNIIDPTAVVSPFVELGQGIFIGKNAVVNAGAVIGDGAIINTGCIVEHDDRIGDFAHVAPGAVLGGEVHIGNDTHIGSNATVLQGASIGERTIIGAGSVVVRDVAANIVGYGNPCREVKTR